VVCVGGFSVAGLLDMRVNQISGSGCPAAHSFLLNGACDLFPFLFMLPFLLPGKGRPLRPSRMVCPCSCLCSTPHLPGGCRFMTISLGAAVLPHCWVCLNAKRVGCSPANLTWVARVARSLPPRWPKYYQRAPQLQLYYSGRAVMWVNSAAVDLVVGSGSVPFL
jgi:hypothetical protein